MGDIEHSIPPAAFIDVCATCGYQAWREHHPCNRCGHLESIRYVPIAQLQVAVEALRRIAAGHAHPSKLAGEALDALPPDDNVYDPPYIERGQ